MGSRGKFRLSSESSQVSMCQNCENPYCEVTDQVPDLGPRRMTKQSISESLLVPSQYHEFQKQYSEIVLSYHKLKISFTVMLILNAILLVVVITCMVFIIPHISTNKVSNSNEKVKTDKLPYLPRTEEVKEVPSSVPPIKDSNVIACQSIKNSLGRVYINGQKVDEINGKMCAVEDLMDSLKQYMKSLQEKERNKAAVHFTSDTADLTTCKRDSKLLRCLKNWQEKWGTSKINVNEEGIIVPKTGIYFIYNRVTITMNVKNATVIGDIEHILRHSNTGSNFKNIEASKVACVSTNGVLHHVSYIEKVHHFLKGDEIMVALKTPSQRKTSIQSTSSFGMFQL
ncbi:TNFSF6 [Mytilus coruscus]|uniref:TNFSF6 n=1 Tax=Mytilus coruscus TaxID=42192 RepID=A0A6J8EM01_MYTCO|nr:TNFSF6 [Mytilus coruscus]